MAESRSHELSVVVVQTLGAVAIAAITGFVTYFNTARPLNAQIEQLEAKTQTSPANNKIVGHEQSSTDIDKMRNDLKESNDLVNNLSILNQAFPYSKTFDAKQCFSRAVRIKSALMTQQRDNGDDWVGFKVDNSVTMILCPTDGSAASISIATLEKDEKLMPLYDKMEKILLNN